MSTSVNALSRVQMQILEYIDREVESMEYMKSKGIAKELDGLSSKQVGTNMNRIARTTERFDIDVWGSSSGKTWQITRLDN
jgi:hypothetical protein